MNSLEAAQAAHLKALHAYEIAGHGERNRKRKALEKAALEVLIADNEAKREERQKILHAA